MQSQTFGLGGQAAGRGAIGGPGHGDPKVLSRTVISLAKVPVPPWSVGEFGQLPSGCFQHSAALFQLLGTFLGQRFWCGPCATEHQAFTFSLLGISQGRGELEFPQNAGGFAKGNKDQSHHGVLQRFQLRSGAGTEGPDGSSGPEGAVDGAV